MTDPSLSPDSHRATDAGAMIAALSHIDSAGFHAMNEALQSATAAIEHPWLGKVLNARIAVAAIDWPDALRPIANGFTDAAGRLVQALEKADLRAATTHSTETHEAYHALSNDGWNHLANLAGIVPPGEGHRHLGPHGTRQS